MNSISSLMNNSNNNILNQDNSYNLNMNTFSHQGKQLSPNSNMELGVMNLSKESEEKINGKSILMVLPKNQNKYVGHIRKFDNRYTFEYISSNHKVKELFYFSDLGSEENAEQAALLFQKKWCHHNNLITNLYYIINNEYILVNLNNNQQMKVDLDDVDLIEKYNWRLQNNSQYVSTFKMIDSKRVFTPFYKHKFNTNKIHFKNNDNLDYRTHNIILL